MTEEKKSRLIDKIKALFRLANNNPSEQESAAALERARQLMLEYSLTNEDVVDAAYDKGIVQSAIITTFKLHGWMGHLCGTIAAYFECKGLVAKHHLGLEFKFVGVPSSAEIAAYSFQSVFNQIQMLAADYLVSEDEYARVHSVGLFKGTFMTYSRVAKREYRGGIVDGLNARLGKIKNKEKQESQDHISTALAIRSGDIYQRYLDQSKVKVIAPKKPVRKKRTYGQAYHHGVMDSREVTVIEKGLTGSK